MWIRKRYSKLGPYGSWNSFAMATSLFLLVVCLMLILLVRSKLPNGSEKESVPKDIVHGESWDANISKSKKLSANKKNKRSRKKINRYVTMSQSSKSTLEDKVDDFFVTEYNTTSKSPKALAEEKAAKYDSWKWDEGWIRVEENKVECLDGHGYFHHPEKLEFEKQQNGIWQQAWAPENGQYMLPFCHTGRVSNLMRCLRGALLLAGLLNRTLIVPIQVPSLRQDTRPHIDIDYVNKCAGENTVISLDDYKAKFGDPAVVTSVICIDEHCINKNRRTGEWGISQEKWYSDIIFSTQVEKWNKPVQIPASAENLLKTYGKIGKGILYVHTDYYVKLVDAPYFQDAYVIDAPFKRRGKCSSNLLIQSPELMIAAGKAYSRIHFPDGKFLAVHVRMGDFQTYCFKAKVNCYYNMSEISACIRSKLYRSNLTSLYIATDGNLVQVNTIFDGIGLINGNEIKFMNSKRRLDMPKTYPRSRLLREGFDMRLMNNRAAFEKVVCASSSIFLGSVGSSFSTDIMRLRHGFGTSTCADDYYCGPPRI